MYFFLIKIYFVSINNFKVNLEKKDMAIRFDNKVAIVTGAGGGIGKEHALELAKRGAKVVVNDLGGSVDGSGASDAANEVVELIKSEGGEAISNGASVTELDAVKAMVNETMEEWGRIDILVNNAGILRDKSFHKVTLEDFNLVMDVHFQGSLNCTHTIYPIMREQEYGRIIFTSSASGVYGNFGQTNYGSAKMAMIGLMNTLKLEGQNKNIFTNSITPVAYTRMTEGLIPEDFGKNLSSEFITPAVIYLASEEAPNGVTIAAGAGVFSRILIHETMGVSLGMGEDMTPENIHANWDKISDMTEARALQNGGEQTLKFFELINN
jgi:NAD(P)-dependent dehydrogenase (short-subunit alcohol dehydrogenase family)